MRVFKALAPLRSYSGYRIARRPRLFFPLPFPRLAPGRSLAYVASILGIEVAVASLPHDEKKAKGGEDAIVHVGSTPPLWGVLDGVGGWAEVGIDPSEFSRGLASSIEKYAKLIKPKEDQASEMWLREVLEKAVQDIRSRGIQGSTTVCVATMTNGGEGGGGNLILLNLGDSGALLLRGGEVFLRTREQQHVFNMPYQLGSNGGDQVKHAEVYQTQLQGGDLLLLASDGVWDNLFDEEIVGVLSSSPSNLHDCALLLAEAAYHRSKERRSRTPFALHARQEGLRFDGGKEDDISIVLVSFKNDRARL